MDLKDVLNRAKARTGSDYKTAQRLNISNAAIAQWRNRPGSGPDDELLPGLAELAELPLEVVTAATYAKRTKSAKMRSMWLRQLEKYSATAGTALGALVVAYLVGGSDLTEAGFAAFAAMAYPEYTLSLFLVLAAGLWLARRPAERTTQALACSPSQTPA